MIKLKGSNSNAIKQQNRALILNIIKQGKGVSRAELSKMTGLSKGGITPIINDLLSMGLIEEAGVVHTDSGRRPTLLKLKPSGASAIVVDWTRKNYTAAIVDLKGNIVVEEVYSFLHNEVLENVLNNLKNTIRGFLARPEASRILGIGVVAPGPIDIEKGIVLSPANFHGWSNIPIKDILEEEFNLRVKIDNNANAYALAEKNYGRGKEYSKFMHIAVDEGIGAGIYLDGYIYRGNGGFGSEIGHISINIDGPVCECGNNGCLEVYATIPKILEHINIYTELGVPSDYLINIRKKRLIEWNDIIEGLEKGDEVCIRLMEKEAQYLGNVLITLINLLEPEAIIMGSKISSAGKFILEPLKRYVSQRTVTREFQKCHIFISDLPKASLKGGAMLILQDFIDSGNYEEYYNATLG